MSDPIFLNLAEVVELHRRGIEQFGGPPEIRDLGLLESALAMPAAGFGGQYLHPDLATMAAAYLFHLVTNHAFIDGNKRIGAIAASTFLLMNGGGVSSIRTGIWRSGSGPGARRSH